MNKLDAIKGSIEKWRKILKSETPMRMLRGCCSLCEFADLNCVHCPLQEAGKRCLAFYSVWNMLNRQKFTADTLLKDRIDLVELVKEMYKDLVNLLPEGLRAKYMKELEE